jgi:hypothetical protein
LESSSLLYQIFSVLLISISYSQLLSLSFDVAEDFVVGFVVALLVALQMANGLTVKAALKAREHRDLLFTVAISVVVSQKRHVLVHGWAEDAAELDVLVVTAAYVVDESADVVATSAKGFIAERALNGSLFPVEAFVVQQKTLERTEFLVAVLRARELELLPCLEVFELTQPLFGHFAIGQQLRLGDGDLLVRVQSFSAVAVEDSVDFLEVPSQRLKWAKVSHKPRKTWSQLTLSLPNISAWITSMNAALFLRSRSFRFELLISGSGESSGSAEAEASGLSSASFCWRSLLLVSSIFCFFGRGTVGSSGVFVTTSAIFKGSSLILGLTSNRCCCSSTM